MATCIDLEARFGRRFRVTCDPAYDAEHGANARIQDPWLMVIPCLHGHLYPHGGELLGAATDKRGAIAGRLAALAHVRVVQDGDDGVNIVFDVNDFAEVAAILKPKRRRQLSQEHRAKLAAAGRLALKRHRNSNRDFGDLERVRTGRSGPKVG